MKPAPSAPKNASQAIHPLGRPDIAPRPAAMSGPTTKRTTSAAEIAISVSNALSPLPKSIDRPNAV